jgi:ATP-binding cassette subfamily C protein LapB
MTLLACLARLAQLQNESVDLLALQEAAEAAQTQSGLKPQAQLKIVAAHLQVSSARWIALPDAAQMPALLCVIKAMPESEQMGEWGILRGQNAQGEWVSEWWDAKNLQWKERADDALTGHGMAILKLSKHFVAHNSPLFQMIRDEMLSHPKLIREAIICGLMVNVVALGASMYSMQVYDRVVPTGASQTLLVLTMGVLAAVMFELITKGVRSGIYERLVGQVDQRLARAVYQRFLSIRVDQLPQSVGALAGQMRGYETVRGFFSSVTTNLLVDAPFALVFTLFIWLIAGSLALVPLTFFCLSIAIGLYYHRQVDSFAFKAMVSANQKTGLLVETIEGAETIKSGQGGWRMLSRWMKSTDDARDCEFQIRKLSEHSQHLTGAFQQVSYILLVALGALMISKGELTMGALIACSILSGRVLAPVATIPNQLVQWAHTKSALKGLDRLWALEDDHHGQLQSVLPGAIQGSYRFDSVVARYGVNKALNIPALKIMAGEKVGILGPVGAGKTTLLRLMSGMYKPQNGRILLDDIELAHIAKPSLADHMGYLQQDGRLFSGTLRDNLILGQLDPGDKSILDVARQTGLMETVITRHPKGLHQEIYEGGSGLSGGQRQLVNLTRAFLRQPKIWLLDEPTASMDGSLELHVIQALKAQLKAEHTLVLVTHKADMLELVDRVIVISDHQIVMDGPKAQFLQSPSVPSAVNQRARA